MKKIFTLFTAFLFLISCTTTNQVKYEKETYVNAVEIQNNKIEKLELKDKFDLSNGEINVYFVDKLDIKNVPVLTLDIDYEKGKSDSIIVKEINGKSILLDFKDNKKLNTINKKIIFMMANKKYENLNIKLKDENKIIDNTLFEIKKEIKGEYVFFLLEPLFLDEDTYISKESSEMEIEPSISFYEENILGEYNVKQVINNQEYNQYFTILTKGDLFKGYAEPGSIITLELDNKEKIKTISDINGKWSTYIPKKYKGNVKFIQEIEKNGIKYISEPITRKVG